MCNCVSHTMHVEVFVYHALQMRFHHIVYPEFDMKTVSIISKQFNKIPVELPMIPQICISALVQCLAVFWQPSHHTPIDAIFHLIHNLHCWSSTSNVGSLTCMQTNNFRNILILVIEQMPNKTMNKWHLWGSIFSARKC